MYDDNIGGARGSDPSTSHQAAGSVNVAARELVVRRVLYNGGPLTMEEVSLRAGMSINTLGPRFAPLRRKNQIRKVYDERGEVVTRPGRSGSAREVYEYQPDKTLWLPEDPGGYVTAKQRHDNAIDAAILVVSTFEATDDIINELRGLKHDQTQ